ncbi:ECF transporter S component [Bacillaceae bacterium Marseille-Q3522]|nr:ECF transporter S component [Bacillaceae bacterium Marseille-Q3522]
MMKQKSMWTFRFSTAALVLIPAAIGINFIGKYFAGLLKLPLWLDAIGTMLASILAGPIIGAISGIGNNIIYGLTADPISFVYAITSGVIGLVVGILAYKGWFSNFAAVILAGIVVGVASSIVSTPLNMIFWEGTTGNVWGDALFAFLSDREWPMWLASFFDSLVVDIPDKLVTVIISYLLFRGLPKSLTNIYRQDAKIEEL